MPNAFITGGARRIGAHLARHLLAEGWDVLLHFNRSDRDARELVALFPSQVRLLQADLEQPEELGRLAEELRGLLQGRGLDLLLHNASRFPHARLADTHQELLDGLFAIHVKAPLLLCRELQAELESAPDPLVAMMLDAGANWNWPGYLAYSLSKQNSADLVPALARELSPGIRVNGIAPGFILPPEEAPESYCRAEERRLTKNPGNPDDISIALDYLLKARFVTGEVLHVDGGRRWLRP